jgi:rare lipoprotein A (peptidoglycan hydrolase)
MTTVAVATALGVAAGPAHAAPTLGQRVLKKGLHGNDVAVLQRVLTWKGWSPGPVDGMFGRQTKRAVKQFQRNRRLVVDGKVGPQSILALARPWGIRGATLYGPGLWGNRTACGQTLRRRTLGIAHRTLRCGRRVPVFHNGRIAILPVIDRGPYTKGMAVDLTSAAAQKLRMTTTGSVRAGY